MINKYAKDLGFKQTHLLTKHLVNQQETVLIPTEMLFTTKEITRLILNDYSTYRRILYSSDFSGKRGGT